MRKPQSPVASVGPGSIRADELLLMREASRRLGWERKTLAHAKKTGLRTIRFGRFDYVTGRSILEFFDGLAAQQGGVSS